MPKGDNHSTIYYNITRMKIMQILSNGQMQIPDQTIVKSLNQLQGKY